MSRVAGGDGTGTEPLPYARTLARSVTPTSTADPTATSTAISTADTEVGRYGDLVGCEGRIDLQALSRLGFGGLCARQGGSPTLHQ